MGQLSNYPKTAPVMVPYPVEYQRLLLETKQKCEDRTFITQKPRRFNQDPAINLNDSFCCDCY